MLFQLLHAITFFFLFFVSSISADKSPAFRSPEHCFERGRAGESICGITLEYPLAVTSDDPNQNCGYPGFSIECNKPKYGTRPVLNISNHIYHVLDVDYTKKVIKLVDGDVDKQGCPQPKLNFTLPSTPSWVNYHLYSNHTVTVFTNCSSVPVEAKQHLICPEDYYSTTNTPLSYAFYKDEIANAPGAWYANCGEIENVVVPVLFHNRSASNYAHAIAHGFYIQWSATEWCKHCEISDGQCWSNSTTTGCACRDDNSFDRTCPTSPLPQGVPQNSSAAVKHQHHKEGMSTGLKIGIGLSAGIGGLFLVILLVFYGGINHSSLSILHQRHKNESLDDVELFFERYGCLALRYKYSDIKKMTNSFKDALGQGGYGQVFKGELHDGCPVAVKVLNKSKGNGEDFINEVATIGRTNHVNVVNLVGFCIEGTRRALVYEFMPNGSLERFIYTQKQSSKTPPLSSDKLYQISLGIARGLEYLHRGCNTRILHFDIKPHNILLDKNFCPKISDFGLAKLYPTRESIVSTVGARGTMGYIAPELYYKTFGNVSHKSDVYSYGMMMLEMIGGRKNIDTTKDNISEIYFPLWIYNHLKLNNDGEALEEMQAKELFEDEKTKKMIIVALWCIQAHPMDRPSMSRVVEMLEGRTLELQMPPNPSVDPRSSSSASS